MCHGYDGVTAFRWGYSFRVWKERLKCEPSKYIFNSVNFRVSSVHWAFGFTKQHARNWEYGKGLRRFVFLLLLELSLLGQKDKTYYFRIKVLEEGKEVILSRRNKINKRHGIANLTFMLGDEIAWFSWLWTVDSIRDAIHCIKYPSAENHSMV